MKNEKVKQTVPQKTVFSFWEKIGESNLREMLLYLNPELSFERFQKKRFFKAVSIFLASLPVIAFKPVVTLIALALACFIYHMDYRKIKGWYEVEKFQRELVFFKFSREVYIYLLENMSTVYQAFERLSSRVDEGLLKDSLKKLLISMNESPNDVQPFIDFANDTSGSDSARLFMLTLYEYQQNSKDDSIIYELGKMTNEQLFMTVDDIIEYKLRKFGTFPTKVAMPVMIVMISFFITLLIDGVKSIQFINGGG
ncbi:hypothetical protein DKE43_17615 [Bacillus pumilus]|uniref:hypothetical protein n=1 Tax=Bacillus pumilus TaxID=1408 RepID=UPI000FD6BCEC|nr:hypothetical protein [Bacillus pumilus]AZV54787.1 hypothetical protein DKE43_17615 [Bacillus pumilus]